MSWSLNAIERIWLGAALALALSAPVAAAAAQKAAPKSLPAAARRAGEKVAPDAAHQKTLRLPPGAFGPASEPLLKGAVRSKRSAAEVQRLFQQGKLKPLTRQSMAAGKERSRVAGDKLHEEFARAFKDKPQIARRFARRPLAKGGKAASALLPTRLNLHGKTATVVLPGPEFLMRDALAAKKATESPANALKLHNALLHKVQAKLSPADRSRFTVSSRSRTQLADIKRLTDGLVHALPGVGQPGQPQPAQDSPPAGYVSDCNREEGAGTVTRTSGDRVSDPPKVSANSLHDKATWPLKWFNTCVKNQANRGTCSAFAVTGAVESLVAAKAHRWVNLSEQDLYKHDRLDWGFPSPHGYQDGYSPPIDLLAQAVTGYKFPWERQWDYNPSLSRVDPCVDHDGNFHPECLLQGLPRYSSSCDGYADSAIGCSDTAHQAALQSSEATINVNVDQCVLGYFDVPWICDKKLAGYCVLGHPDLDHSTWVCTDSVKVNQTVDAGYRNYWYETDVSGDSRIGASSFSVISGPYPSDSDLRTTKATLDAGLPVVLSLAATQAFQDAPGGYVAYRPGDSNVLDFVTKGHCILVTGALDNAQLPAGIPPGAGGGYLIIKNSWGVAWGDQGYGYLPYQWVKENASSLTALLDVSTT